MLLKHITKIVIIEEIIHFIFLTPFQLLLGHIWARTQLTTKMTSHVNVNVKDKQPIAM